MTFGVGPYGFGTPVPAGPPAEVTLGSSRRIGTDVENRGQYVIVDGNPAFDTDTRQLVILALTTQLGSSAVVDLGRGAEPPDFGGNFLEQKRVQINAALSHLVKDRMIRIESVQVEEQPGGRSVTRLELTDLTTSIPFTVEL
jgi:hypothetical protein